MLREIPETRQVRGEPRRRWFYSEDCELTVWLDDTDAVVGFQLSYGKTLRHRALTWKHPDEYLHTAVDVGERRPGRPKAAPILTADGTFDGPEVEEAFLKEGAEVPADYSRIVLEKVRLYSAKKEVSP